MPSRFLSFFILLFMCLKMKSLSQFYLLQTDFSEFGFSAAFSAVGNIKQNLKSNYIFFYPIKDGKQLFTGSPQRTGTFYYISCYNIPVLKILYFNRSFLDQYSGWNIWDPANDSNFFWGRFLRILRYGNWKNHQWHWWCGCFCGISRQFTFCWKSNLIKAFNVFMYYSNRVIFLS